MTYPQIEKISTKRFPEVDFISMGPWTCHKSCKNANEYVKNNIDYIVPDDVRNILILDVTWSSEIPRVLMDDLETGKAPYDYVLMYNLFDGWHQDYNTLYTKLKEHYRVNIIGPQPLEPENFFNFHEYNVASWTSTYGTEFIDKFDEHNSPEALPNFLDKVFFYYGGAISTERMQFIYDLWKSKLIYRYGIATLGLQGGMTDSNRNHYPDGFGILDLWRQSIVNIVSETRNGTVLKGNFPGCFVTEKTFKPIFAHLPFIHINQPRRFTEFLTNSCGYKLYNSFFDLPDHDVSNEQVIASLIKVTELNPDQRLSFYKTMLPTIKHNYNNLQERADRIHNMFSNRIA